MANRFLSNVKINDAYTLPETIGTTGQYIKLTDAGTGTTAWADLGQATEVSTISYDVRNETGSSIPVGSVVYVSGGAGSSGNVKISLSIATTEAGSSKTFGVTAETIANNSDGKVVLEGIVEGIDTSSYTPGQTLWLSTTAGQFTGTPPTTPNHAVFVGYAVRCQQNNGSMFVKIQNGYELGEIHDVLLQSSTEGDILIYDGTNTYWKNSSQSTSATRMPSGTDAQRPTGAAGMFRFNTTSNQFEGFNGTTWGAIAGSGGGTSGQGLSIERDVFTATANQTVFTISSTISSSSNTQVYIDGVYQAKSNYTTSGSTVTFFTGVPAGAEVEIVHFISVFSKIYTDAFTGDNTTVNFTASKDVTDENVTQIYIDGVYQSKDNYTTSGTTITFSTAPPNGSAVEVVHFTALDYSSIASNQFIGTGSQTQFTLTQEVDVDKAFVFIQGVYQEKSTYSISGTTLTFTTAPLNGYTIEVITIGAVSVLGINLPSLAVDTDTLYVDNVNNRVGVNTSSPQVNLQVEGTIMNYRSRYSTNQGTTYWDIRRDSSTGNFVISDDGLGDVIEISQTNGNVAFDTNTLYVDSTNNRVGIGTSSPTAKLDVVGTIECTSLTETSALRFKENIQEDIDSSIIDKLRPVSYDWKETGDKDYGFIAEEVDELESVLTTKDEDGQLLGIKYTKLIPFLVKKIQEQEKRIKQLENGNS